LVALAADGIDANGRPSRGISWAFRACLVLLLALAAGLAAAPLWLGLIREPSMPGLQASLLAGPWFELGALLLGAAAVLLVGSRSTPPSLRLLRSQLPLVALVPLMLLPLWRVSDGLRGAPVRDLAALVRSQAQDAEPLAMVGLMKPSLHYYSRRTVLYEGRSPQGLLNLVDRLRHEQRPGLKPSSVAQQPNLLLVIDAETAALPHWLGIGGVRLAAAGPYTLLRLDRRRLEQRAQALQAAGLEANWRDPRPERY